MFEVRELSFTYRNDKILRDISFTVSPGETVAIVGANGAGKTTLLKILATLFYPDSGMVLSDGHEAFAHPMKYRRQLGYLPEQVSLYDDMTAKEYLKYRAQLKGEPAKRVRRRVSEAAELCKIGELLDLAIGRLSLGQKKRIALADALMLRPEVLLLDDLLNGLDYSMRAAIGEILSEATNFTSVVLTGHEINDMASWADKFFVLREGVLSEPIVDEQNDKDAYAKKVYAALAGGGR